MSTLYIVATPIGNLEDITLRALRVLKEVDTIVCEDTRVTKKLLMRYEISKPTISLHGQSSEAKINQVLDLLEADKTLAYVSDAGTPGISDPGAWLVAQARERLGGDCAIVPIPGPSALTAAYAASGFSGSDFLFLGFLPHKKGRQTLFAEIKASKRAVIFYESPHRIVKTLQELSRLLDGRTVMFARELTKMFEDIQIGTADELLALLSEHPEKNKGEFVVLVAPL